MKKIFLLLALAAVALACLTACGDDEKGAMPPIYQGFRVEPSTRVHPGDVVTITAVQAQKGRYLYGAKYSWTMKLMLTNGDETELIGGSNEGGESKAQAPTWTIEIPENVVLGRYSCQFQASWNNAADGEIGTYNGGTADGCVGSITSSCATLYSRANGSFALIVE